MLLGFFISRSACEQLFTTLPPSRNFRHGQFWLKSVMFGIFRAKTVLCQNGFVSKTVTRKQNVGLTTQTER